MSFALVKSKETVCRERARKVSEELYLEKFNELRKTNFSGAMMLFKKMKHEEGEFYKDFMENYVSGNDVLVSFDSKDSKSISEFNDMLLDFLAEI